MIKIEKGTLLANLGSSLILLDYHLASNLTSVVLAYNWVFLDFCLLNSNSVGTNYTVSSYYFQFAPDTSNLLTAALIPSGFLCGRFFFKRGRIPHLGWKHYCFTRPGIIIY